MGPLGILGGGQLGRMTLEAASALGVDVVIAERFPDSPAARMTASSLLFPDGWHDPPRLRQLAAMAPTVTLESEFVDADALATLAQYGARVLPPPACVRIVQDKLLQKRALAAANLPVPAFEPIASPEDVIGAADRLGWPVMLKARRDGYDGHGNVLVRSAAEVDAACARLGLPDRTLYAEAYVDFERELAAIVVRGTDGAIVQYPVVETRQDPLRHICHAVVAPAPLAAALAARAASIARAAVEAVGGVGTFGVELFLLHDQTIAINELAPRPHNSGHYTMEACRTSQFDNHVRAVFGLPLGSPALVSPAAVMVNLLGSEARCVDLPSALRVPDVAVHLYGKTESRPGRKMGHVTALADDAETALARAEAAAACLKL